eukprot:Lithocolla_globosa_v1_NODE_313_length_4540_cov_17.716005.p3 type:complete len:219 gc:universal NODE_313_length_4540_cov_17.716005:3613-4269(+)
MFMLARRELSLSLRMTVLSARGKKKMPKKMPRAQAVEEEEVFEEELIDQKMTEVVSQLKDNLTTVQIGKAHPSLLDGVVIEVEGSKQDLSHISQISVRDVNSLIVKPYQPKWSESIVRGIMMANLDLTPRLDKHAVHVKVPKATQGQKDAALKKAREITNNHRQQIDNIQREGLQELKTFGFSSDLQFSLKKQIEAMSKKQMDLIKTIFKDKEKNLLS